ncbi:MAG: class I SAM-dependent methyltransferase [Acidimicrobiia bacterium]
MSNESIPCPACAQGDLDVFYEVDGIPAHSTLLLDSREVALAYPRGEMRLGFCRACGFMANTAFDISLNNYSTMCEETQGYSPYFARWIQNLAQEYVDRYDLRGVDIAEIGCGKGEFLALVCAAGENRGLGIDPSYVEGRVELPDRDRLTFVNELYTPEYGELPVDVIACRHTLEHIGPVGAFVAAVRASIADGREPLVYFELPETLRVLREQAFWDIDYEHCSYFTPGSLARLFRAQGFDPIDLRLDYGDQYVLIDARPGAGDSPTLEHERDLEATAALVEEFRIAVPKRIAELRGLVTTAHRAGRRVVIWGGGSKGVAFLTTLGITDEIEFAVDIDPNKQGMYMAATGHEVIGPEQLRDYRPDLVIPMNAIYRDEIAAQLHEVGLAPELVTID